MATLLRAVSICKAFPGVKALDCVNLEIESGEIHAIVGENGAGKSTLMKIFVGIYQPDLGEIFINGNQVKFDNTRDSQAQGLAIIHQELNIPTNLCIYEYLFLGRLITKKSGLLNKQKMIKDSERLLAIVGLNKAPTAKLDQLTIAEQQLVEITRALSMNNSLLIMDEPTSALNQQETQRLFQIIGDLKQTGVTIIYISHKLDEIQAIADRITIMRDGQVIETGNIGDYSHERIVMLMTGKVLDDYFARDQGSRNSDEKGDLVMEVKGLSSKTKNLNNINFELRKGEVLGIGGLLGAGRTELFKAIFGADKKSQGEIFIHGKKVEIHNPYEAVKAGIGFLPEDRKKEGLILQMDIGVNISLTLLDSITRFGFVNKNEGRKISNKQIEQLSIRTTGHQAIVQDLSGGNQQKVVFGKWLASNPKVLLLDDPTRGVDVGAKHEMYSLMRSLAQNGIGIVFVSSELPELVGVCDRVLVMRRGEIVYEAVGDCINENNLMLYATGKRLDN